jgi:hypothetical protein
MGLPPHKGLVPITGGLLLAALGLGMATRATGTVTTVQRSWVRSTADWDALEVGRDGRSLEIGYRTDSCGERNAHVIAREGARTVTFVVPYEIAVYQSAVSCPAPKLKAVTIRLRHRLAGRRILGRSHTVMTNPRAVFGTTGFQLNLSRSHA